METNEWTARLKTILEALPDDPKGRFQEALSNGSMLTGVYAPIGADEQQPHAQDEIYFVALGSADFVRAGERVSVKAGDAMFVPAWTPHRLEKMSEDLAVWVVFYGSPVVNPSSTRIDTREELVNALVEAAELEHGLLVQYLFAAFSLKRRLDEGMSRIQRETALQWERSILQVCQEEMFHLAHVNNLLTAIGAAPWLGRPNFPQQGRRYPEPFKFQLERFSLKTIARFVLFELPVGEALPKDVEDALFPQTEALRTAFMAASLPDPLKYDSVGSLYAAIADAFGNIPEANLFLSPEAQVLGEWGLRSRRASVFKVFDRASALRAIAQIVQNGEGSPEKRAGSHYETFLGIFRALKKFQEDDASFELARPVCANPALRSLPDSVGEISLLSHPVAVAAASLFDGVYGTMLMLLLEGFTPPTAATDSARLELVRTSARRFMSAAIRPLAEVLTQLPAFDTGEGNAGPPFGTYGPLMLPSLEANRWPFLKDRLQRQVESAVEVCKLIEKALPHEAARMARVRDVLDWTMRRLDEASGGAKLPVAVPVATPDSNAYPLEVIFSGWMQVRLATDPDPSDEPRGVSGYISALPSEPDLDRIIRFQPPFVMRTYGPQLGVNVEAVRLHGQEISGHNLVGMPVNLDESPVFKGENGVVAEDGLEPIVPFTISVSKDGGTVLKRGTAPTPDHARFPFPSLQATSIGPAPLSLLSRAGLVDPKAYFAGREKRLTEELEGESDPISRLGLATRVKVLSKVGSGFYGFQMTWRVELAADDMTVFDTALPGFALYRDAPWVVDLAIGCWDPDVQCSYVHGTIWLPGWKSSEPK